MSWERERSEGGEWEGGGGTGKDIVVCAFWNKGKYLNTKWTCIGKKKTNEK